MSNNLLSLDNYGKARLQSRADLYLLDVPLERAVRTAIALAQPLLLTGEPGTGKTQLAYKVAQVLHHQNPKTFEVQPFEFDTKTTSAASDLFYTYDAVGHFHASGIAKTSGEMVTPHKFVTYQALGKAIKLAQEQQKGSVVLIDEIDKAPRDFPNDLLREIESYKFHIRETGETFARPEKVPIVVLMTSNSEKNLPDAFLRRCVFYHIPFPDKTRLAEILNGYLPHLNQQQCQQLSEHFSDMRSLLTKKKPATAEFIAWVKMLDMEGELKHDKMPNFDNPSPIVRASYSILAKTTDDLRQLL